jgi:hypothetical protein
MVVNASDKLSVVALLPMFLLAARAPLVEQLADPEPREVCPRLIEVTAVTSFLMRDFSGIGLAFAEAPLGVIASNLPAISN